MTPKWEFELKQNKWSWGQWNGLKFGSNGLLEVIKM